MGATGFRGTAGGLAFRHTSVFAWDCQPPCRSVLKIRAQGSAIARVARFGSSSSHSIEWAVSGEWPGSGHLALKETNALMLRRGPYAVVAGLDKDPAVSRQASAHPVSVTSDLINLFDPDLSESSEVAVQPGTRALLLDVNYFNPSTPRILAASAKIMAEHALPGSLAFEAEGIDQTNAVVRILSTKSPREITVNARVSTPANIVKVDAH
jgi:hypothetical protein